MFEKILNWILISVSAIAVIGIVVVCWLIFQPIENKSESHAEAVVEDYYEDQSPPETEVHADYAPVDPGVDEFQFQQTLHEMTHQKIHAEAKRGAVRITDEKIDGMLKLAKESDFQNKDFYIEVLTAWRKGDFSNAVDAHNKIWKWQDGEIGRATRLLTAEEEQQYINEHFKN